MPDPRHAMPRGFLLAAVALVVACIAVAVRAEAPEIGARRAAERKSFTDAEIRDGFFKIAFGAEMHPAGPVDRIRKYDRPVRVHVESYAAPDRRREVADVVADIGARIDHLDIAMTDVRQAANVVVTLVHDRDLGHAIRALYGRDEAKRIERSLEPQCLSGFRKDESFRIINSDVVLVVDAGDFIFYDCVYEELLQALGPINDDSSIPWTMFNDNVHMGFFDIYDQYLLNILYDPRIHPGMNREEVRALLPQVLPQARAWVGRVNALTP